MDYAEQVRRLSVLEQARNLARSGAHPDAASIEAALRELEVFADVERWFEDRRFRAQLNRLCVLAQTGETVPRGPRGARRSRLDRS